VCPTAAVWGDHTGETMAKLLNEFGRGSKPAIPPSFTPCPLALADRDRREALRHQQSLTAAFFGDPLPGMSALDRRETRTASLTKSSRPCDRSESSRRGAGRHIRFDSARSVLLLWRPCYGVCVPFPTSASLACRALSSSRCLFSQPSILARATAIALSRDPSKGTAVGLVLPG
jgi:hypothetical protein